MASEIRGMKACLWFSAHNAFHSTESMHLPGHHLPTTWPSMDVPTGLQMAASGLQHLCLSWEDSQLPRLLLLSILELRFHLPMKQEMLSIDFNQYSKLKTKDVWQTIINGLKGGAGGMVTSECAKRLYRLERSRNGVMRREIFESLNGSKVYKKGVEMILFLKDKSHGKMAMMTK